jgi:hypothetical protein
VQARNHHEKVTKLSNSLPTEPHSRQEVIMRASESERWRACKGIVSHWTAWTENRRWNN